MYRCQTGETLEQGIPFLKTYSVFNVEQITGLPDEYYQRAQAPSISDRDRIAAVETFFDHTGASIEYGGSRACYDVVSDRIRMPNFDAFIDPESFYATQAHEVCHWTRHPTRLNRDFGRKRWGDEGYAMEELVAEIGNIFLCADLGLSPLGDPRGEHIAYLSNWLSVLKSDKRAIFTAAAHAQRAVTFLHDLQPAQSFAVAAE